MSKTNDNGFNGHENGFDKTASVAPLASLFLGPHAENAKYWEDSFNKIFTDYVYWRKNYYPKDGYMLTAQDVEKGDAFYRDFSIQMEDMLNTLKDNFPFFSPRYMAHMLSEQTLPAVMGYFATMLYNPNNVTEEAAPVTVAKELEFGRRICTMLGYDPSVGWAHLCSGGSAANLEALWVARQSQFFPLVLRDICKKNNWKFKIKLPNCSSAEEMVLLTNCTDRQLLHLKPNESIYMMSKLSAYLRTEHKLETHRIKDLIQKYAQESKYNIRTHGYGNVLAKIGLKPIVFVPQSAHYSLKKTMNILGYGEDSVRPIPTNEKFRIDVSELERLIREVKDDEYIAAVVAVFGTTEEGAIDPVHEVKWLRDKLNAELNLSFWFHVDAAWGGYFAVMKHISEESENNGSVKQKGKSKNHIPNIVSDSPKDYNESVVRFIGAHDISEDYHLHFDREVINKGGQRTSKPYHKDITAAWSDKDVFAAMFALPAAESITVDPHKMGYIPYPAGLVAFRNKRIVYLLSQEASYIGTDDENILASSGEKSLIDNFYEQDDAFTIPMIGAFTLEGSRPGAAAMSCWFASEVAPLDREHHGKIVKTTVLNAKKFAQYLSQHAGGSFIYIDERLQKKAGLSRCETPFIIELLYENVDTNLVCFFVRPGKWDGDYEEMRMNTRSPRIVVDDSWTLEEINDINKKIHAHLTISPSNDTDSRKTTLHQKFYVADTKAKADMYSPESMAKTLARFGFSADAYKKHGLEVLRSTIMNPWYFHASSTNHHTDYFTEFLEEIHFAARNVIDAKVLEKRGNTNK